MKLIILPRAEKELRKLPAFDQIAITQKIRSLPDTTKEEKLSGYSHIYRVRVGDYRIVYKKTDEYVHIILIRHRREVYKLLKELLH